MPRLENNVERLEARNTESFVLAPYGASGRLLSMDGVKLK